MSTAGLAIGKGFYKGLVMMVRGFAFQPQFSVLIWGHSYHIVLGLRKIVVVLMHAHFTIVVHNKGATVDMFRGPMLQVLPQIPTGLREFLGPLGDPVMIAIRIHSEDDVLRLLLFQGLPMLGRVLERELFEEARTGLVLVSFLVHEVLSLLLECSYLGLSEPTLGLKADRTLIIGIIIRHPLGPQHEGLLFHRIPQHIA